VSFNKTMPAPERNHPCFYAESKKSFGRIHLPVAPSCNIQCAYCRRDNDCLNENRPGVTSSVISPQQALYRLERVLEQMPFISVAGIAGPGDAFCEPGLTLDTFKLIRSKDLKIALCVSTNGANLIEYIPNLRDLKVQFITVTINAIDPGIGAILYKKVKTPGGIKGGTEGAGWLIDRQMRAVSMLKSSRFTVKINSVIVPGVNDSHIPFLAKRMQSLGADLMNLIPLIPLPATDLAEFDPPHPAEIKRLRSLAGQYVPQMYHCGRCRSDAAGLLDSGHIPFGHRQKK